MYEKFMTDAQHIKLRNVKANTFLPIEKLMFIIAFTFYICVRFIQEVKLYT